MAEEQMHILNLFHGAAGDHQTNIHDVPELPAIKAGKADGGGPRLFGQAEGVEDVLRVAAAAYPYDHIPGLDPGGELAGKDLVI
jgi:hypothetical protein